MSIFGSEFFPVTSTIAHRMLDKVSGEARNFLEPNAGRGDLASIIKSARRNNDVRIDCIETNPDLVAILRGKGFDVVGYDWLEYNGVSYYDAIVMNPPFSNGDDHLLKAWDFIYAGEIVCLLNAETLRNPHTKARQRLARIIEENSGQVEQLGQCFSTAMRKTDVDVAMVYLCKKGDDDAVDLWVTGAEEKTPDLGDLANDPMLAVRDKLGNMEHYYNMANTHMAKAFAHLHKAYIFMKANNVTEMYDSRQKDYDKIVALALRDVNHARAEFGRKHRRDAWMHVFNQLEFHKWLDKLQREQFLRDVETNGNIPFTAENIKGTLENIIRQRDRLFEQSVANVFDSLTKYFHGNGAHTEGWKTNDSYKVNMKLIFPWGCGYDYGHFSIYRGSNDVSDIYNDLDRVVAVLDKRTIDDVHTVGAALHDEFQRLGYDPRGPFSEIESTYFRIRYFKKGTVHLKWKRKDLWEKFNIAASAGKRWLGEDSRHADWEKEAAQADAPSPEVQKALAVLHHIGAL